MNKSILIISNPGEPGASNYCEGVNVDVDQYQDFFKSPLGGGWYGSEISHLSRPSSLQVKEAVGKLASLDYSLILFCGHGWYSSSDMATVLELRHGQQLNEMELRKGGGKRAILLDCCREVHEESIVEASMEKRAMDSAEKSLSGKECRKYYEDAIAKASSGLIITHACNINETAGDSSTYGGYYSGSLRRSAIEWMRKKDIDLKEKYSVSSIVTSHDKACRTVNTLSGGRQNPQIEKPKSDPYYPFAVLA